MMGYFLETLEILCHGSEITVAVAYVLYIQRIRRYAMLFLLPGYVNYVN